MDNTKHGSVTIVGDLDCNLEMEKRFHKDKRHIALSTVITLHDILFEIKVKPHQRERSDRYICCTVISTRYIFLYIWHHMTNKI